MQINIWYIFYIYVYFYRDVFYVMHIYIIYIYNKKIYFICFINIYIYISINGTEEITQK